MAKNCWLWVFGALLLFGVVLPCAANPPRYAVDKVWTSDHGLPENAVITVAQTRDGYLWLGTLNGLARFDGLQFTVYDEANTPALNSPGVVRLFEDSQTNFWVGTDTAGVLKVDPKGQITNIGMGRRGREGRLMGICEDLTGAVWLYTADGQLGRYRDGRLDLWAEDKTASTCRAVVADDSGLVWVGSDTRLTAYGPFTGGVTVGLPVAHERAGSSLGKLDLLLGSKRGGYWRFANRLIQKCRNTSIEFQFPYPWSTNAGVSAACEDRDGNLIVGTLGEGVFLADSAGHFAHLDRRHGLSDNIILSLCPDREGCLWIGTDGGGLDRAKPQVFDVVQIPGDAPAQTVCEDGQGGFWLGFNGGGVVRWKDGQLTRPAAQSGLSSYVRAVFAEPGTNGNVWAGTRGGLFVNSAGSWAAAAGLRNVSAIYRDRAGALWFGTEAGLRKWEGQRFTTSLTTRDGLSSDAVRAVVEDRKGNLWIGTEGGGLNCRRDAKTTVIRKEGQAGRLPGFEGLPSDNIQCLFVDNDDVLWAGTSSGLARLKNGKWAWYSKEHGLVSNSIGYIIEDQQGYLWIGSNAGLMRAPRSDFTDSPTNSIRVRTYGKSEGLPSGECTFGSQPAACCTRQGQLWLPTIKGFVSVNPAKLVPNPIPPQVIIESVRFHGQLQHTNTLRAPVPQSVLVPPGSGEIEISYTSLNLSSPEKGLFRYRLEGHETAEQPGDKRSVRYPLLPPGDYVFAVTACNEDRVWNRNWSTLAIKVLPPFWRTWWFIALVSAILLGLVTSFVHYVSTQRLQRQLEHLRQKEAIEKERARIARDIHDQVGASLTQVSLLGELVESDKDHPEEVEAHGRQISQAALETTRALDEIVWTVNPSNDTLDSLITYICKYAQDYMAVAGLRYRLEAPESLPATPISPELRHNVFLAAREAINNIVKHARATSTWLRLQLDTDQFVLEIEDNGRGLEPGADKKGRNGLRNMRKRMEDVGGRFEVTKGREGGTTIRLAAPLNHRI